MKRYACLLTALLGVCAAAESAYAGGPCTYGGYQPWWNIFAHRRYCMSAEEERLQRFWHDYYDALKRYYGMLDRIDWVSYYKNHGYQINAGCGGPGGPGGGSCRVQFAPVFVSPSMNWAVPNSCLSGPPGGPPCPPPGCFPGAGGPMAGGMPGGPGGMGPMAGMPMGGMGGMPMGGMPMGGMPMGGMPMGGMGGMPGPMPGMPTGYPGAPGY
jgi:hypothetical protein